MSLDTIKALISNLPEKDIKYANKFITERRILDLKELVDSVIVIVEKKRSSENCPEEYKTINIEELNSLKAEVDSYYSCIYGDEDLIEDEYE